MVATENKIAMRPDIEVYMNLDKADAPVWSRCGKGWKKFAENPNAQTESTQVHQRGFGNYRYGFLFVSVQLRVRPDVH